MCELFPIFRSCCGIPVRIALIFIAVLSIVTGAMINAGLKKAGVNIANIDDVKDLNKDSFKMKKVSSTTLPVTAVTQQQHKGFPEIKPIPKEDDQVNSEEVIRLSRNQTEIRNVIVVTPMRTKSVATTTKKITRAGNEELKINTVEILGYDIVTTLSPESEDDGMNTEALPLQEFGEEADTGPSDTGPADSEHPPDQATTKTTTRSTTTTKPTTTSDLIRKMGAVNRNGINFMACAFIALGILLLAANFTNSTELGLLYVLLSLVNCIVALFLLVGTVGECTKTQHSCLLSKMDWFSGFLLTLFWFMYIFLWVFFAGVANAFANGLQPPSLAQG